MTPKRKAYFYIHFSVLLYGFTAIIGDLITLKAVNLVWWRVFIASICLWILIGFGKTLKPLPQKTILKFLSIGAIVGIHWITFFGSIKLANASIALVCMATTALFTSLLEPAILKKKLSWVDLSVGLVIIPAMSFIAISIDLSYRTGLIVGLISAFLAALFSVLNKKWIKDTDAQTITFLEMLGAWICVSLILPFTFSATDSFLPAGAQDWVLIGILAMGCTVLAYVLTLRALEFLSAFTVNLTINLEPVYGIILAAVILKEHEQLNTRFYLGCSIIILAVFLYPTLKSRLKKASKSS